MPTLERKTWGNLFCLLVLKFHERNYNNCIKNHLTPHWFVLNTAHPDSNLTLSVNEKQTDNYCRLRVNPLFMFIYKINSLHVASRVIFLFLPHFEVIKYWTNARQRRTYVKQSWRSRENSCMSSQPICLFDDLFLSLFIFLLLSGERAS